MSSVVTLQRQQLPIPPQLQPSQSYQQYIPSKPLFDGYSSSSTASDYSLNSHSYSSSVSSLPPLSIVPPPPIPFHSSQPMNRPNSVAQSFPYYSQSVQQYPNAMSTGMTSFVPIQDNNFQSNQPVYIGSGYDYRPQLSSGINKHNSLQSRIKSKATVKRKTKHLTTWTQSEDELLRGLKEVQKLGWREISTFFHERTPNACEFRWRRIIRSINEAAAGKPSPKARKGYVPTKTPKEQMIPVTNIDFLLN
ncbi:Transcriptional regulatory protein DOT6 [Spathaspora sp. JA1]|nr:Transcriptional regulatory protein DOT6 [Spathaspora sp. JA1]